MEKTLGVTQARNDFRAIVDQVQYRGDTYIVSRHGKPAAAIVPVYLYERWKQQRDEFFELIHRLQQQANLDSDAAEQIAVEAVTAVRAAASNQ